MEWDNVTRILLLHDCNFKYVYYTFVLFEYSIWEEGIKKTIIRWMVWLRFDLFKSYFANCRIRHPEVLCKKGVLSNFAKFTGKHMSPSLFFNKVAGLRPATLLKKRLWQRCFLVNFAKFLRTPFLIEHLRWLLLYLMLIVLLQFENKILSIKIYEYVCFHNLFLLTVLPTVGVLQCSIKTNIFSSVLGLKYRD